jgi:hypothetical protein
MEQWQTHDCPILICEQELVVQFVSTFHFSAASQEPREKSPVVGLQGANECAFSAAVSAF